MVPAYYRALRKKRTYSTWNMEGRAAELPPGLLHKDRYCYDCRRHLGITALI